MMIEGKMGGFQVAWRRCAKVIELVGWENLDIDIFGGRWCEVTLVCRLENSITNREGSMFWREEEAGKR